MNSTREPPVPDGLREMLKAYPGHIERLQQALNWVVENPASGVQIFERAIWALERRLETFISEARRELQSAESSGDAEAVAQADCKLDLMFSCRSSILYECEKLSEYFDRKMHEGGHHG